MLLVSGLLGALELFILYPIADTLVSVVPVVVIICYGVILMKAQKKYLVGR